MATLSDESVTPNRHSPSLSIDAVNTTNHNNSSNNNPPPKNGLVVLSPASCSSSSATPRPTVSPRIAKLSKNNSFSTTTTHTGSNQPIPINNNNSNNNNSSATTPLVRLPSKSFSPTPPVLSSSSLPLSSRVPSRPPSSPSTLSTSGRLNSLTMNNNNNNVEKKLSNSSLAKHIFRRHSSLVASGGSSGALAPSPSYNNNNNNNMDVTKRNSVSSTGSFSLLANGSNNNNPNNDPNHDTDDYTSGFGTSGSGSFTRRLKALPTTQNSNPNSNNGTVPIDFLRRQYRQAEQDLLQQNNKQYLLDPENFEHITKKHCPYHSKEGKRKREKEEEYQRLLQLQQMHHDESLIKNKGKEVIKENMVSSTQLARKLSTLKGEHNGSGGRLSRQGSAVLLSSHPNGVIPPPTESEKREVLNNFFADIPMVQEAKSSTMPIFERQLTGEDGDGFKAQTETSPQPAGEEAELEEPWHAGKGSYVRKGSHDKKRGEIIVDMMEDTSDDSSSSSASFTEGRRVSHRGTRYNDDFYVTTPKNRNKVLRPHKKRKDGGASLGGAGLHQNYDYNVPQKKSTLRALDLEEDVSSSDGEQIFSFYEKKTKTFVRPASAAAIPNPPKHNSPLFQNNNNNNNNNTKTIKAVKNIAALGAAEAGVLLDRSGELLTDGQNSTLSSTRQFHPNTIVFSNSSNPSSQPSSPETMKGRRRSTVTYHGSDGAPPASSSSAALKNFYRMEGETTTESDTDSEDNNTSSNGARKRPTCCHCCPCRRPENFHLLLSSSNNSPNNSLKPQRITKDDGLKVKSDKKIKEDVALISSPTRKGEESSLLIEDLSPIKDDTNHHNNNGKEDNSATKSTPDGKNNFNIHNRTRTYYSSVSSIQQYEKENHNDNNNENSNNNSESEASKVKVEEFEGLTPPRLLDEVEFNARNKRYLAASAATTVGGSRVNGGGTSSNNNNSAHNTSKSFLDSDSGEETVLSVQAFRRSSSKPRLKQ